jgi:c-di-GMP-related signal transduction protein
VFGHELLFRTINGLTTAETAGPGGDHMTADLIFSSVSIGVERLVGDAKLFCNASRGVLSGSVPVLLPPEQTVIEIAESVLPPADVLPGCRRLHDQGFSLALDGVTWWSDVDYFDGPVSYVKVDIQAAALPDLSRLVKECHRRGIQVVGEKVDSIDEFEWCESLGFDFFQGYLLAQPSAVSGRALDTGRVAQLRLSTHLLDRECPMAELEEIIRRDPAMTLQLLQLASVGAAKGMRRTVRTLREALVLVGWRRLQSWVCLLLIGGKGQASQEEMTSALTRARMCELLARSSDPALAETAFIAGMLSSFGTLLHMPLEDVLADLPLDADLRDALLRGEGTLGRIVADAADFLLGRPLEATRSGLEDAVVSSAALDALLWSVETTAALAELG